MESLPPPLRVVHQHLAPDGETVALYAIYCPGCKAPHHVNDRWSFNGDIDRPTFSPSLLVTTRYPSDEEIRENLKDRPPEFVQELIDSKLPDVCHSFVTDGQIQFLADSTHALAGQTVALTAW